MIPFNKPYLTGKETYYIEQAVKTGKKSYIYRNSINISLGITIICTINILYFAQ